MVCDIAVAANQDRKRGGVGHGEIDLGGVSHFVVQVHRNDVIGTGHHSLFHFGSIVAESEPRLQLERAAHLVKKLVLETDRTATIEKVVGRVAMKQYGDAVASVFNEVSRFFIAAVAIAKAKKEKSHR